VLRDQRLVKAFCLSFRERTFSVRGFRGKCLPPTGLVENSHKATPAFPLTRMSVVVLKEDAHINNGQPSLHAACLAAVDPQQGDNRHSCGIRLRFTTPQFLAEMVGPGGAVHAYEV